jgi:two-component sensor histidine kinase
LPIAFGRVAPFRVAEDECSLMRDWLRAFQFWRPENARSNLAAGCIAAIVLIFLVLGLRYLIALGIPQPPRLIFFSPVILAATLIGGARAGFFALVVSTAVGGTLMMLETDTEILSLLTTIAFFAIASGFIIWIAAHYRSVVCHLRDLEERRALLHRELLHRSRNLQMVIHAIVRHTLQDDRAKADEINGRISSLAAASHLLNQSDDQTADLKAILQSEMQIHGAGRASLDGPSIQLPSMHAKVVALVFHELGTNAAKHGSLSVAAGRVHMSWTVRDGTVRIQWLETNGPTVNPPNATGFGTVFVQHMLQSVQGAMRPDFGPDGFACEIEFKLPSAAAPDGRAAVPPEIGAASPTEA